MSNCVGIFVATFVAHSMLSHELSTPLSTYMRSQNLEFVHIELVGQVDLNNISFLHFSLFKVRWFMSNHLATSLMPFCTL